MKSIIDEKVFDRVPLRWCFVSLPMGENPPLLPAATRKQNTNLSKVTNLIFDIIDASFLVKNIKLKAPKITVSVSTLIERFLCYN